jgi:hypothetical protein
VVPETQNAFTVCMQMDEEYQRSHRLGISFL